MLCVARYEEFRCICICIQKAPVNIRYSLYFFFSFSKLFVYQAQFFEPRVDVRTKFAESERFLQTHIIFAFDCGLKRKCSGACDQFRCVNIYARPNNLFFSYFLQTEKVYQKFHTQQKYKIFHI